MLTKEKHAGICMEFGEVRGYLALFLNKSESISFFFAMKTIMTPR